MSFIITLDKVINNLITFIIFLFVVYKNIYIFLNVYDYIYT